MERLGSRARGIRERNPTLLSLVCGRRGATRGTRTPSESPSGHHSHIAPVKTLRPFVSRVCARVVRADALGTSYLHTHELTRKPVSAIRVKRRKICDLRIHLAVACPSLSRLQGE